MSAVTFKTFCKDCEQIERNERKNADRPLELMKQRTTARARKLGVSFDFMWTNMNWSSLVPELRAAMTDGSRCQSCGHLFLNERDIQIEHREPPRFLQDWAREQAKNIALFCQSCNNTKGNKSYAVWLDEQEDARLANERTPTLRPKDEPLTLF
jgi:5-methylcytosine-specific restriction endonuclease McrA